jgi:arsenate reductase (thioredoxin)
MAEAFLRVYGGEAFEAFSAGLEPKGMNPLTIRVMQEIGFDLSEQYSKGVDQFLGKVLFQYLITVCDQADKNCPVVWPGVSHRMHWSFVDPAAFEGSEEEKLVKFREVRDQISRKVQEWLSEQSLGIENDFQVKQAK